MILGNKSFVKNIAKQFVKYSKILICCWNQRFHISISVFFRNIYLHPQRVNIVAYFTTYEVSLYLCVTSKKTFNFPHVSLSFNPTENEKGLS